MIIANKKILVAGGTGSVGEGIVRTLLSAGATVIVPVRNTEKAQALQEYVQDIDSGKLVCLEGNMGDIASANLLKDKIWAEFGKLDMVVASLGGWWQKQKLHEIDYLEWLEVLQNNFNSHFIAIKVFVPLLLAQNEGMYVMINGGASEMIVPQASPMSILASAQKVMTQALAVENNQSAVKFYNIILNTPIITRKRGGKVNQNWISAEQVGEYLIKLYEQKTSSNDKVIHRLNSINDIK